MTLEEDGTAMFPDAPTQRGVKHLKELCACLREGYRAGILFVIQMKGVSRFIPNDRTHPEFGEALRAAAAAGVRVLAYDCLVTPDTLSLDGPGSGFHHMPLRYPAALSGRLMRGPLRGTRGYAGQPVRSHK